MADSKIKDMLGGAITSADNSHKVWLQSADGTTNDFHGELKTIIGAMVTGNTETGIAVTYQAADATFDFVAEVSLTGAETLTNKVIDADNNTITNLAIGAEVSATLGADIAAGGFNMDNVGVIFLTEQADADADVAGQLQLWANTATPNEFWYTDDAGSDFQVASLAGTETLSNKTLVAPALGTPASGVATNLTGTAAGLTVGATTGVEAGADVTDATNVAAALTLTGHIVTSAGFAATLGSFTVAQLSTALSDASISGNNTGDEAAADLTTAGVIEVATAAEINTGTDAGRAVSPDTLAGSNFGIAYVQVVAFDYTTDCATGNGAAYLHIPAGLAGMNLVEVHAECITAGTTTTMDIQIANVTQAADMLSTVITIDSTETGSDTGAIPAVIDTVNDDVAENDMLRIDVDSVHTTAAKGLIVTLGFQLP